MAGPIVRQELVLFATSGAGDSRVRVGFFSEVLAPPAKEFLSNLLTGLKECYRAHGEHPIRVGAAAEVPARAASRLEKTSDTVALLGPTNPEATPIGRLAKFIYRPWRSETVFIRDVDSTLLEILCEEVWPISRLVLVLYRGELSWSGQQLLRSAIDEREPPPLDTAGVFAILVSFHHGRWLDVAARACSPEQLMQVALGAATQARYDLRVVADDGEF